MSNSMCSGWGSGGNSILAADGQRFLFARKGRPFTHHSGPRNHGCDIW
jgi:hypothetical protein